MNPFVNEIPVYETLANGNAIIIIYDLFILLLFLFELFLFYNKERIISEVKQNKTKKIKPVRRFLVKLIVNYEYQGILMVTGVLLVISLLVVSLHHRILFSELIGILGSFAVFIIIVFLVQHLFMKIDQFQDIIVSRFMDLIFYLVLGHYFVLFANFITPPSLPLGLLGLSFALILCFSVMIRAIANPTLIRSSVSKRRKYHETASILKGMLVLVVSEMSILYLMVYNCFKINPGFYVANSNRALDAFDMLYYMVISFATIGYGDIHPVRFNGIIYGELVAMVIGLASMFSTACFVGAVVAGAAQMSWNQGMEGKNQDNDASSDQDEHNERRSMISVIHEKLKNKEL
ncbi:potassium channel family protein [Acetobacterium wieringae]|uniref:potassium channel family protein n=1 Tax=Acetobacterium wieringae TaxID=52694 RepID=UPI00203419B5|nr:potassium channel family protein [Acetobacterium wieringae]URN85491.1 potassium channel family protein [Acetobacterium wieringae]